MENTIQLNRSQSEHSLKHDLGDKYGFKIMANDGTGETELVKDDLEEDFSLPEWISEFKAKFYGENRISKSVQFEKLIEYIK